jgi:PAS domain S-box-containing protein
MALLSVALALQITLSLRSYLGSTPTPLFFAAVIITAWYGGLNPSIVATVLSTLAINYFLSAPIHTLGIPDLGTLVRLGIFVMAALLINSLNQAQRTAQRKAEANFQSLRESEARFGCLAESNIIGMIVSELDGVILEANRYFLQMVGYTEEDLRAGQLHWRKMTPPESMDISERAVQELLTTGACTPFEKQYIRKDGSRVPVLHGAVMTGEATVTGFVLNLSEPKRLEAIQQQAIRRERTLNTEVQTANAQLETVLASIKDQFLILDHEWRYIYVSDRVVETVGRSREELLGKCIWELFPETVNSEFYIEAHRAVAEQRITQFEYFYFPWQRWFENRLYPSEAGLSVLVTEITDRKRAEEALRQSEARFQVLVSNMPGMVYRYAPSVNGSHAFTYISSGSCELVELEPESILQDENAFFRLIHPDDLLSFRDSVRFAVENTTSWKWEGRLITPSGQLKWVQGRSRPQETEYYIAWDGLFLDITDRKQAQIEQQQAAAEREQLLIREKAAREAAETANRIKDEFLAVLSHELRSPLNPILGWSRLLQAQKLDEQKTQQALLTIERNAKLQTQLIEDLLDVSRILRGKLALNIAPVSLVSTTEAALETVRLAVEAKGIQLHKAFNLDLDQVMGDAARLQQVIWNLLSNAVKFTASGGRVDVRLERVEEHRKNGEDRDRENRQYFTPPCQYARITVADTGKGINPNFLPYVFDYFRQEDGTTTRKFGGLGLGLAIVRHITELHGGTVWAESLGEGQGATFTVQLPLISTSIKLDQDNEPLPVADLTGLRVLVVDDDADIRALIEFVLEQAGAEVRIVTSATEAIEQLDVFSPEVLISDVGMPEVDGHMLIRQIRSLPTEQRIIPAIALTAYASEIDQQQAIAAGFQMHLAKPVEPEKLINAIINLLQNCGSG